MKTPRGKSPSLIGSSNGKPTKIAVKKKSKCYRCDGEFDIGQNCIGIPKIGSSFKSVKRCCFSCFQKILEQTQKDFEEAKNLISEQKNQL